MGSSYLPPPEQNVVNVGDEISVNALQALQNASPSPTSTNPVATNQSVATAIAAIPLPPPPNLTGYAQLSGATFTGKVIGTPTASSASFNLGTVSSAPSTLANGDVWIADNLNYRDRSGVTKQVVNTSGANAITSSNATSNTLTVTQNGNGGGLRVLNNGTGDSFRVEDESPESSPFVIDANGKVGIGGVVPAATQDKVAVHGGHIVFGWPYGVRFGDGTSIYSTNSLTSQIQAAVLSNIFSGGTIYSNTYTSYGSGMWYDNTYMYDIPYTYVSYTAPIDVYWNASTASFSQNQGSPTYPSQGASVGSFSDGSGFTHTIYADGYGGVGSIS